MTETVAPIGWFEIAGPDPVKIEAFYGGLFGWSFADGPSGPDYRMVDTGSPIAGGVTKPPPGAPASYASFGVMVGDIAESCAKVTQLGGRVMFGPQEVGDTGLMFANIEDLDGNHLVLIRPPAHAVAGEADERSDVSSVPAVPVVLHEDVYGTLIDHPLDDCLEIRWYDASASFTGATFNDRQEIIADAVEGAGRSRILIDAVQFDMDAEEMDIAWRDANTIPRLNNAGVKKQALIVPTGFPPIAAPPAHEGPAEFLTAYFATRAEAQAWLRAD